MAETRRKESAASMTPGSPITQQYSAPGLSQSPPAGLTTLTPVEPRAVASAAGPVSPLSPVSPTITRTDEGEDRRLSDEWDASKVPPSRFQKRKGSIYAVPGSRDSRTDNNREIAARFWKKLAEMDQSGRGYFLKKEKFQE